MTLTQPTPIDPSPELLTCDERGLGALLALSDGAERPFPLTEVRVRARIAGACSRTVVEQVFANALERPVEAVHIFPLPEDGAITEVELRCGEVVVRAECREREAAQREFEEAREAGRRAALLTQERDDVHTLRVTNLPPGESVSVRIVIVENLPSIDGRFRWRFPTVIPPRYLPGNPVGHDGPGILPDSDQAPDASRLQPPLRLAGGTRLDLEVELAAPVANVESSLHALCVNLDAGGGGDLRISPSGKATLNQDFVLAFATGEPDRSAARAWTDGTHTLVVVEPPTEALPPSLPRDAVFVVDVSGSMGGAKMTAAKEALVAALHGLTPGDRFRLIAFDNRLSVFAEGFSDYDDGTLAQADAWVSRLAARGGTEMLPAIQAALEGETPQGRLRTVLFITDGQAWNEDQLVAAVAGRRRGAAFFTLGIDTAVNASMLKRLARAGGGTCEFATPGDDIEAAVAGLEARFGSPVADDVRVAGCEPASLRGVALFAGRPATILLEGAPESVTVQGVTAGEPLGLAAESRRVDFPLGALWARERVAALQDRMTLRPHEDEALRAEIVRIALEHGIASRFTSFVAVEQSRGGDGEPVVVVQPTELPTTWDPAFAGAASMPAEAPSPRLLSRAPARMAGPDLDCFDDLASEPASAARSAAPRARAHGAAALRQGFATGGDEASATDPEPEVAADPAARLARTQGADGSFGGDVARTAAALLALVLLGHTRRKGLRRRTVKKAADWLTRHVGDAAADLALAALATAERGKAARPDGAWRELISAEPEGACLAALL